MIRHNLFWKIVALGAAVALWAYVNSERNPHTRKPFSVPIEVHNMAKGYEAEFSGDGTADVAVEGLKTVVDSIAAQDVRAWVSLGGVKAGRAISVEHPKVHASIARVAKGSVDITIAPRQATVRVEAVRWKQLPVEVKLLSAPPLGYAYSDPEVAPRAVGISGKTTAVSRVKRLICAVSCEDHGGEVNELVPVSPVDAKGNVVSDVALDADRVRLKMRFVEAPARKSVIVSPEVVGEPKFPGRVTRISVKPTSVTVEARPNLLINMSTLPTEPISIAGATDDLSRDVGLRLPAGVKVVGRSQVRVRIEISAPQR